ncbi:monovalent cation/H(+) antiporter subunit G [Methanocalculus sp. AMF5]|uniref:monovalent cation/H(+) antiporter subunit G n=1 Tax=Methanocalculus sp. AMF5 TaxID=1198257 RepID=UPI003531D336
MRFPDFFCRLHATTKCDTLGQTCILLGIALIEGFSLLSVKVLAIAVFLFISSPTAAQSLSKAAYWSGIRPENLGETDEYADTLEEKR